MVESHILSFGLWFRVAAVAFFALGAAFARHSRWPEVVVLGVAGLLLFAVGTGLSRYRAWAGGLAVGLLAAGVFLKLFGPLAGAEMRKITTLPAGLFVIRWAGVALEVAMIWTIFAGRRVFAPEYVPTRPGMGRSPFFWLLFLYGGMTIFLASRSVPY